MNTQVIGLPPDSNLVDRVRKLLATVQAQTGAVFIELDKQKSLEDHFGNDPTKHFFYLEVSGLRTANGRLVHRFVSEIQQGASFDMQFGRVLACHLMNRKERVNWKNCDLAPDEQTKLVQKFKAALNTHN